MYGKIGNQGMYKCITETAVKSKYCVSITSFYRGWIFFPFSSDESFLVYSSLINLLCHKLLSRDFRAIEISRALCNFHVYTLTEKSTYGISPSNLWSKSSPFTAGMGFTRLHLSRLCYLIKPTVCEQLSAHDLAVGCSVLWGPVCTMDGTTSNTSFFCPLCCKTAAVLWLGDFL